MKASDLINTRMTQLDRMEAKLDKLLAAKKPKAQKAKRHSYDDKFELIWKDYPRVAGTSKISAYGAYQARLRASDKPLELSVNIHVAVIQYSNFIKATDRYVMHAATFFGPAKHYENDWAVPIQADTLPKENDKLCDWAANKGYREPYPGEEFPAYRRYLEGIHPC